MTKPGTQPIFAWRALVLAPALVPALAGTAFTVGVPHPVAAFLLMFAGGGVFSYGATLCLLIPCLYLLRLMRAPNLLLAAVLGAGLGFVVLLPVTWLFWAASGPDSGPPQDTLLVYLTGQASDPFAWFFPVAGSLTASLYWLLLPRQCRE